MSVHYKRDGIATFDDTTTEKIFQYMSAGNHPHVAFKSHRLVGVSGNVVTVEAEVYNPDASAFKTTITHKLIAPRVQLAPASVVVARLTRQMSRAPSDIIKKNAG